jgi:hypothetical protein
MGTWTRYSVVFSTAATIPAGGIALQLQTDSAQASTFLVDGIQLELGEQYTPWVTGGTALIVRQAYSTALSVLPDTSSGIHLFQNTSTVPPSDAVTQGHAEWVWNDNSGSPTNPNIPQMIYFPFDRDSSTSFDAKALTLAGWNALHPDWVEYVDSSGSFAPAYEFGDTTYIPIDTANQAALVYFMNLYWKSYSDAGYAGVGYDNISPFDNSGSWSGPRRGHWSGTGAAHSGSWVPQYDAASADPAYRGFTITWAQAVEALLHAYKAGLIFAGNLTPDPTFVAESHTLLNSFDLLFDEQGFNDASNVKLNGANWLARVVAYERLRSNGQGVGINCFLTGHDISGATNAELNYYIANYLLVKGAATWLRIAGTSSGTVQYNSAFAAPIGTASQVRQGGNSLVTVHSRLFSNGLALVNPDSGASHTFTLPGSGNGIYQDLFANLYNGQQVVTLTAVSGLVLVNRTQGIRPKEHLPRHHFGEVMSG